MSTSTNMHSKTEWSAKSHKVLRIIWVTIEDGEGSDVTFFFRDADLAERVAAAFNHRTPMFAGSVDAPENSGDTENGDD